MPSPSTADLPIPRSWEEFEDIASDVLRRRWKTQNVTRNGRGGQAQDGIDIFALAAHVGNRYVGAQCKRVDSVSTADIDEIVGDADEFEPPLAEFFVMTTVSRDAKLQRHVRAINMQRLAAGKCAVEIMFWEDISLELSRDKQLLATHFPNWSRLSANDEEPEFEVAWMVDGQLCTEITIPALSPNTTDILGTLDPYADYEIEHLRHVHPGDLEKALAFNDRVHALARDPEYQKNWRLDHAAMSMIDGTRVGVVITVGKTFAADALVQLELGSPFDVFPADARPTSDIDLEIPEHPRLESERRHHVGSWFTESDFGLGGLPWVDPSRLMRMHLPRSFSLRAGEGRVRLHVDRISPRRTQRFVGDEDGLVIGPWCEPGRYIVKVRADAENRRTPQLSELAVVVTPSKCAFHGS